jgi:hypothetical protein
MIGLAVGLFILLGGAGTVVALGLFKKVNADEMVTQSFKNLLSADQVHWKGNLDVVQDDGDIKLDLDGGSNNAGLYQIDTDIDVSSFQLSGSIILDRSQSAGYIKINELSALLGLTVGNADVDQATKDRITSIASKYIKISESDIRDLYGQDVYDAGQKCYNAIQALSKSMDNKTLMSDLANAYKNNMFVVVSNKDSLKSESYANAMLPSLKGKKIYKLNIEFNEALADKFVDQVSSLQSIKDLGNLLDKVGTECQISDSADDSSTSFDTEEFSQVDQLSKTKLSLWVEEDTNNPVHVSLSYSDLEGSMALESDININEAKTIKLPSSSESISLVDAMKELGIYDTIKQSLDPSSTDIIDTTETTLE